MSVNAELRRAAQVLAFVAAFAASWPAIHAELPLPLKLIADITLPGPTNRFDYQSLDLRTHRLFIAHLGASTVVVIDTHGPTVVGEVKNLRSVHGVLAVAELGRVYASATGTNEVVAIDASSLTEIARLHAGIYPDGLAYAPDAHKLYVSDETGRTETVIDVQVHKVVATVALGGQVGNTQYDPVSGHIFVNVQTLGELVEIDPRTDTVVARHKLSGARGNHGLLIDVPRRVAYIGCEGNATLLSFDLDSKQLLSSEPVGDAPDVLAFDPMLHRLYVASESGVVTVFEQNGKQLRKLGESLLAKNAHSVAVDPDNHRVYFPIENIDGRPVLRVMEPSS